MNKTIQGFREKDYGLFIDLTDAMSSVSVDRKTGNLVLQEGAGPDRFNGALITSDFCHGFTLSATHEGNWVVALRFGDQKSHVLGITDNEAGALQWLKKAWDVIRSNQTTEQSTAIIFASASTKEAEQMPRQAYDNAKTFAEYEAKQQKLSQAYEKAKARHAKTIAEYEAKLKARIDAVMDQLAESKAEKKVEK